MVCLSSIHTAFSSVYCQSSCSTQRKKFVIWNAANVVCLDSESPHGRKNLCSKCTLKINRILNEVCRQQMSDWLLHLYLCPPQRPRCMWGTWGRVRVKVSLSEPSSTTDPSGPSGSPGTLRASPSLSMKIHEMLTTPCDG